jgi:hypothetical protein
MKSKALEELSNQIAREMKMSQTWPLEDPEFRPKDFCMYSLQRIKSVLLHIADHQIDHEKREAFKAGFREAKKSFEGKGLDELYDDYQKQMR